MWLGVSGYALDLVKLDAARRQTKERTKVARDMEISSIPRFELRMPTELLLDNRERRVKAAPQRTGGKKQLDTICCFYLRQ
jgi:hypothetical protein